MVWEILQWLPAKSLVKFRSVCKEWFLLISSTTFKQQHTLRLRHPKLQQQSFILQTAALPRRWFHLNPNSCRLTSLSSLPSDHDDMIIVQSSNGLLLLQPQKGLRNRRLYVHNPATGQSRKIIPPHSNIHHHIFDVALAFNPSKSPYYELVCFRGSLRASPRVDIYSSKSHSWKELSMGPINTATKNNIFFISFFTERERVYWNNTIYWCSKKELNYQYFNIATQVIDLLFGPDTDHADRAKNA